MDDVVKKLIDLGGTYGGKILLAIAVYGSLLIKSGCITENELVYVPKGRKIIRLARKLRLL